MRLYPKADGFYQQDSAGVETPLFGGGGATYVHPDPFTIGTLTATNLTVTGITGAGADDPLTPGQKLVTMNALTITPGTLHTAGLTVNGIATVNGVLTATSGIYLGTGPTANLMWGGAAAPDTVKVMQHLNLGGNLSSRGRNASMWDGGMDDPLVPGQRLIGMNAINVGPGTIHAAGLTVNGIATINSTLTASGAASLRHRPHHQHLAGN